MSEPSAIINNNQQPVQSEMYTFACLEQPETLDYLKYLKLQHQNNNYLLNFNSEGNEGFKLSKKTKKFSFNTVYDRSDKIRHKFSSMIKQVAQGALKGENHTFLIYGTQQKCKDKIIFGQSQNAGLFLCTLSQLFQQSHLKAIQDEVTIKFSCVAFNQAKFVDIFEGNKNCDIQFAPDYIEGGALHTVPQIIIRNVKTGLKLLNIALKKIYDLREEEFTQNLILTLKLELDYKKQQNQVQTYCISKINFIKLANPSINSSLKGVNKNNIWFVNFLNFIQAPSLLTKSTTQHLQLGKSSQKQNELDIFTHYISQQFFKSSHKIYGFVSITNKMSSNECLTALLFCNHLKNFKSVSRKFIIDIPELHSERANLFLFFKQQIKNNSALLSYWIQYFDLLDSYMNQLNFLQFQYSLVIGEACDRLSKYIFTQELEDFFYAKKTALEASQDLVQTYSAVNKIRQTIKGVRRKIIQNLKQQQKMKFEKLFELEFSMCYHFLIDDLQKVRQELKQSLIKVEKVESSSQSSQKNQIKDQKMERSELQQKQEQKPILKKQKNENLVKQKVIQQKNAKQNQGRLNGVIRSTLHSFHTHVNNSGSISCSKAHKKISSGNVDNLECMFTNKNVGNSRKIDKIV